MDINNDNRDYKERMLEDLEDRTTNYARAMKDLFQDVAQLQKDWEELVKLQKEFNQLK